MLDNLFTKESLEKLELAIKNNKFIHLKSNKNSQFDFYGIDELNNFLNTRTLNYPYVNLTNFKSTTCKNDIVQRTSNKFLNAFETKLSKKSILYRIAKGDTLIINHIQESSDQVMQLISEIENLFNCISNANLYYSFKNTLGINAHFDLHDVLALQCHGKKKWYVLDLKGDTSQAVEKSPKPDLESFPKTSIHEFILETGDLLYIPKGFWHYAETKNESSMHLAISLNPFTVSNLLDYLMSTKLEQVNEESLYDLSIESLNFKLKDILGRLSEPKNSINYDDLKKIKSSLRSENVKMKLT